MPFHQGCDVTVAGATAQVSFPRTAHRSIFYFCWPCREGSPVRVIRNPVPAATASPYTPAQGNDHDTAVLGCRSPIYDQEIAVKNAGAPQGVTIGSHQERSCFVSIRKGWRLSGISR